MLHKKKQYFEKNQTGNISVNVNEVQEQGKCRINLFDLELISTLNVNSWLWSLFLHVYVHEYFSGIGKQSCNVLSVKIPRADRRKGSFSFYCSINSAFFLEELLTLCQYPLPVHENSGSQGQQHVFSAAEARVS